MKSKVEIPSKLWGKNPKQIAWGEGAKRVGAGIYSLSLSLSLSFVGFAYFTALSFISA